MANVRPVERVPRIAMALAAGAGAAIAPPPAVKVLLYGAAAGLLMTVATNYCPVNAWLDREYSEADQWRTLRSWRVEP